MGTGPDVVLVPGTFSDRRAWHRLIGALTPNHRCLLLDPRGAGATPDPGTPFTVDELADDDEAVHLGLVLPAFGRDAFERLVPAVVHDMDRHPLRRDTILRYVACDRAQDLRAVAGRVDAPVMIVAGAEDTLTGPAHARALAEAIPGARLELIPGCGHTPQVERPGELARLVVPFLAR